MAQILVASKNPVKMNAAKLGFTSMFPETTFEVQGISVPSGVPDQPLGDEQTLLGAMNRVAALSALGEADYYLGIEGGIAIVGEDVQCFAWIVVRDRQGKMSKGRTGMFLLPKRIVDLIHEGYELGVATDMVFDEKNSKQNSGSVGILTDNLIDRTAYYHHAIILALIAFKNPHLF
jgi:inosine/xanthosine triphosphatase